MAYGVTLCFSLPEKKHFDVRSDVTTGSFREGLWVFFGVFVGRVRTVCCGLGGLLEKLCERGLFMSTKEIKRSKKMKYKTYKNFDTSWVVSIIK